MDTITAGSDDDLRRTWENQQAIHKRDRELRFQLILDHVHQLAGEPERVLDLGCGPGSLTHRVLARFPRAQVVALDLDPLLLHLAAGAFATDARVDIVRRNLNDPDWSAGLAEGFDAVVSTTALHWLSADALERVYRGVAGLLRPGGVFANADWMLIEDDRLRAAAHDLHQAHLAAAFGAGAESCDDWYHRAYALPEYQGLWAERERVFAHWDGDLMMPASWHLDLLRRSGFTAADLVWRRGNDALAIALT
jgi:SAM-dependent methyltransferase